ncbi:hypothetical protein VOLCADRAFT_86426 [Volvox carteri f. nagariensis]|uniref:Uncharacterized protein n=1 Tax=Volvox carteri f. nagariensis TaxID=3068 RepID=D8TIR3_VOLCA|nr:uncharacterized protein VOLCADRAFT_86426 [Volvox carteri f. nagariensis]EFJ53288.1 hypothetical protein VOLCADRAFT_86426 [Volvox carteri f. nagariensis]|eukprot:XP_002946293.1 hypothetical protein VOLCADRAFT_86426 [Volvox carteri f. nagariensis]
MTSSIFHMIFPAAHPAAGGGVCTHRRCWHEVETENTTTTCGLIAAHPYGRPVVFYPFRTRTSTTCACSRLQITHLTGRETSPLSSSPEGKPREGRKLFWISFSNPAGLGPWFAPHQQNASRVPMTGSLKSIQLLCALQRLASEGRVQPGCSAAQAASVRRPSTSMTVSPAPMIYLQWIDPRQSVLGLLEAHKARPGHHARP